MQLQQLAYFVAVAETRHFTRAAHRMGVAQPSLSQQIRALEADLDAPLLHRTRGNVTLTDAGRGPAAGGPAHPGRRRYGPT